MRSSMPLIKLLAEYTTSHIDILFVYILEAHASDEWKLGNKYQIPKHKTLQDRIAAAKLLKDTLQLPDNVTLVCDSMENTFEEKYCCWPDRCMLIQNEVALVAKEPSKHGYARVDILCYLMNNMGFEESIYEKLKQAVWASVEYAKHPNVCRL